MKIGISINVERVVLEIFAFTQKEFRAQLDISPESILVKI